MTEDQKELALFKFRLISPIINEQVKSQNKYCRELAKKKYDVPGKGYRKYKWETFKGWLKIYRKNGFDGLFQKNRCDKGVSRILKESHIAMLNEYFKITSFKSYAYHHKDLIRSGALKPGEVSYQCFKNYIKNNGLQKTEAVKKVRKRFEVAHINELWVCDFMHLPQIKKQKYYLCAIMDDHSRMIVGAYIDRHENSHSVAHALKSAILQYGNPDKFYCDNGPAFVSGHLQEICARLQIALLHSRPYDPSSRGKIERFMRTVRQKFLPDVILNSDLDDLNRQFQSWLDRDYHVTTHSTIKTTPKSRYFKQLEKTGLNRIPEDLLEVIFYETIYRKVNKDNTISINNDIYEVPGQFVDKKIELRFPKSGEYYLFVDDKLLYQLQKVNVNENAQFNHLRFKKMENNDV